MAQKKTTQPAKTKQKLKNASKERGSQAKGGNGRSSASKKGVESVFDDRTKRDVAGVFFAILALALFFIAYVPTNAIVSSFLSNVLHMSLGLGCYLLPLVLLVLSVTFLIRFDTRYIPLRVALGLLLIMVMLLALFALYTPDVTPVVTNGLFASDQLAARGGLLGACIAWCGLKLFGRAVSTVLLVGFIIIGMIVVGFSLSRFIESLGSLVPVFDDQSQDEYDPELDCMPAPPAARIRRGSVRNGAQAGRQAADGFSQMPTQTPDASNAKTQLLDPKQKQTKKRPVRGASLDVEDKGLPVDEAPKQLTRKLGKRKPAEEAKPKKSAAATKPVQPDTGDYTLPAMSLLKTNKGKSQGIGKAELRDTAACLQETLEDFNIMAEVVGWVAGPTVTLYKVDLPPGVRVSRITALEDDIALALAAPGVRIFAPIPGTNYVGIEVPNRTRESVLLGDVLPSAGEGLLQIAIGKDVEGNCICENLAAMPHLLIGGTTGSGKSISVHGMITSILMRATPDQVRFIMIDPKRVEFSAYNGIPHLYIPVVIEPKEAAGTLAWAVAEMERRLKVLSKAAARDIGQYNAMVNDGSLGEDEIPMPYIVIVIDELADLMMNVGKEVEFSISRLAQLARAAGIHLIIATQRPSANVVTGLIKANITSRIGLTVASGIDSRVIIDSTGAEKLTGKGDLLLSKPEYSKPVRVQGCFVSTKEIADVVNAWKEQGEPDYHTEILKTNVISIGNTMPDGSGGSSSADDPLIWEAAEIVVNSGLGSTSNIQRRLKVGYSRAGRIMDMLEEKGVVGAPNGSKPREVLVDMMELDALKALEANDALNAR